MKRKVISEKELKDLMLPGEGQTLGRVARMMGGRRLVVLCSDGKRRLCRIRGKLRRRMWIREGDVVLVSPWEFEENQGDIVWRYTRNQVDWLEKNGYLTTG
jgi:translation initiation factor 1A